MINYIHLMYETLESFIYNFINKAYNSSIENNYLCLDYHFRKDVRNFSFKIKQNYKSIIRNIFTNYNIINIKYIKLEEDDKNIYLKVSVYDKIHNTKYNILCLKDNKIKNLFPYNELYEIILEEYNKYKNSLNVLKTVNITVKPIIPNSSYHGLPYYKWIHSQHYKYGEFSK